MVPQEEKLIQNLLTDSILKKKPLENYAVLGGVIIDKMTSPLL